MSADDQVGQAQLLIYAQNLVGESPVWDDQREGLWWVDVRSPALHFLASGDKEPKTWRMPAPTGFIVLCENGKPLVGLASGLHMFDPVVGKLQKILDPLDGRLGMRLNEGQVDPDGHLWFGVMQDKGESSIGSLMRWRPGYDVEVMLDRINIPNGLSFGADASETTFADSADGRLLRLDKNGSERSVILPADGALGVPDGAVRDLDGYIWLARFGGGCVLRIDPDGHIERRIDVPAPNVTAVTLGGDDGRDLYITTASLRLNEDQLMQWPLSGSVFCARSPAPGRPARRLQLQTI